MLTGLNWKSGRCSINQVSDPMHKGKLCVSFDEDSAVSVTLGQEGKLWDMRTGETKLNLGGHHGIITTVRVASKIVVSGSVDCTLKIFDKQTGSCLDTLIGHDGEIVSVHYKDGGDIIVSGSEDHTIRIWVKNIHYSTSPQSAIASPLPAHPPPNPFSHKLPQDWQQFRILRGHSDAVTCLHFDDSHIVSGSADHTIRIWNFNSSRCLTTLNGHQGSVFCLQFNNQFIVSGGADAKICVWKWRREMSSDGNSKSMNVALYRVLDGQMGHESAVVCLQFDKDKIVSGSTDNSIKVSEGRYTL